MDRTVPLFITFNVPGKAKAWGFLSHLSLSENTHLLEARALDCSLILCKSKKKKYF